MTLTEQAPPNLSAAPELAVTAMEAARHDLTARLVENGLISAEFEASGALDKFVIDEEYGVDALAHILVGNHRGGAHHLASLIGLETQDRVVASTIHDPARPDVSLGQRKRSQRVKENGVYRAGHVEIPDEDGTSLRKVGGSTMFPDTWSTQEVLEAIIATSQTEGVSDPDRHISRHVAEVNGVKLITVTDDETGKIITSHPK